MKRNAILGLTLGLLAASCGGRSASEHVLLCTIFPEYEWAKAVLGETDTLTPKLLIDNGSDAHSFNPTVNDFAKIATADLFVYVGGESDFWVADALKNVTNPNQRTLNLMDALGDLKEWEEAKEGMQGDEEEEEIYDEHVWLSLINAKACVQAIADQASAIDEKNKDVYASNAAKYVQQLEELHQRYLQAREEAKQATLLIADRFPFRYLTRDYNLDYFAAFSGCSAESEASAETIAFLARKADELGVKAILKIDGSNGKVAETVRNSTRSKDQSILTLDSIQSTTTRSGKTYLGIMEENLGVLKEAMK